MDYSLYDSIKNYPDLRRKKIPDSRLLDKFFQMGQIDGLTGENPHSELDAYRKVPKQDKSLCSVWYITGFESVGGKRR